MAMVTILMIMMTIAMVLKLIVMVMMIIVVIILCDPCENFDKVETKFEKRLLSALPGSRPPLDQ